MNEKISLGVNILCSFIYLFFYVEAFFAVSMESSLGLIIETFSTFIHYEEENAYCSMENAFHTKQKRLKLWKNEISGK